MLPKTLQPETSFKQVDYRSREVLRHLIDTFVDTGEPVGSRVLAQTSGLNLSPATIRNIMADLEDMGLLHSPHTSAGRLPTQAGLQLFVDALLQFGDLPIDKRQKIEQSLDKNSDLHTLLDRACEQLSGLTRLAGLVMAPKLNSRLRHLEFIRVNERQALVVIVTEGNIVENRLIQIPKELTSSTLQVAGNFIRAQLVGKTINEIQTHFDLALSEQKNQLDHLTRKLVNQGVGTLTGGQDKDSNIFIVHGHSHMLEDVTVIEDLDRMRLIFSNIEQYNTALSLLSSIDSATGVKVFIGAENSLFSLSGCSAIVAPINSHDNQTDNKIIGAIGVVGPLHMNYGRILPMVDFTAQLISKLIFNREIE